MKICSKCKKEKEYSDFYINKQTISGYTSWCKSCFKNEKKIKICEICKTQFIDIHGKRRKICYSAECKRKRKNRDNQKYKIIKDGTVGYKEKTCIVCNKIFKPETSRQKVCSPKCQVVIKNKSNNNYMKKIYKNKKNTPEFELKRYIRGSLRRMISKKKNKSSSEYVDYPVKDLRQHLESLFQSNMNWNNYGKWHIDHKKPLCLFKFVNSEGEIDTDQVKKSMSLNNLQPLWAKDNLRKNKYYDDTSD